MTVDLIYRFHSSCYLFIWILNINQLALFWVGNYSWIDDRIVFSEIEYSAEGNLHLWALQLWHKTVGIWKMKYIFLNTRRVSSPVWYNVGNAALCIVFLYPNCTWKECWRIRTWILLFRMFVKGVDNLILALRAIYNKPFLNVNKRKWFLSASCHVAATLDVVLEK